jgi:hypothetical protein
MLKTYTASYTRISRGYLSRRKSFLPPAIPAMMD